MSTVYVIMNGRFSARIPKLDLRPPNNEEERSENVAAEATSKMLATTPKIIDVPQINLPLRLKVWRIMCKNCTKDSPATLYSKIVGPDGLEPSTHGLKVRCSTD